MKKNYKRFIALLLTFTVFFFTISSYKQKEVKAFDLVITPTIIWTLGALALGTGITIVHKEQIIDIGQSIADKIDDWKQVVFEGSIRLSFYLLDKINNVIQEKNKNALKNIFAIGNTVSITLPESVNLKANAVDFRSGARTYFEQNIGNLNPYFVGSVGSDIPETVYYFMQCYSAITGTYLYHIVTGTMTYDDYLNGSKNFTITRQVSSETPFNVYDYQFNSNEVNYSADVLPYGETTFKERYDPIPYDEPYDDTKEVPIPGFIPDLGDVSKDNPITWDRVKDTIKPIPIDGTDTDTEVGELDDTWLDNGNGEEPPEEQKGLWGWLASFLLRFINGLKAIWSTLQNILNYFKNLNNKLINGFKSMLEVLFKNFIKELLSPLIQGFKDLLTELFKPKLNLKDLFTPLGNTGFSNLGNIMDWSELFDIAPKPFRFSTNLGFDMIVREHSEELTINIDELPFLKDNITFIRNLLSFPLLMGSFWFVIHHFLPKREID